MNHPATVDEVVRTVSSTQFFDAAGGDPYAAHLLALRHRMSDLADQERAASGRAASFARQAEQLASRGVDVSDLARATAAELHQRDILRWQQALVETAARTVQEQYLTPVHQPVTRHRAWPWTK